MAAKFLPLLLVGLSLVPSQLAFTPTECGRFSGDARSLTTVVQDTTATTAPRSQRAYILGGLKGNAGSYEQLTDIIMYDLSTGKSSRLNMPFPIPVSHGAATFHGADGKTIYYFGGGVPQEGKYDTNIYKLTVDTTDGMVTDTVLLPDKLTVARAGASAVSIGSFIYIFGGYVVNGTEKSDEIIKFDPTVTPPTQTKVATLPIKSAPTSTVVNGKDVFIFGEQNYVFLYNVDSTATVATNVTTLQHVPTSSVAVKVSSDMAYVLGTNQPEDGFKQNQFQIVSKVTKQVCADVALPDGISGSTIYYQPTNQVMIFGGNMTNNLHQSVLCVTASSLNNECPKESAAAALSIQLVTFIFTSFAIKFNFY